MIRGAVHDAIKANYSRLNLIWTEGVIESLTNLRSVFGNDMDKIVVLAVIGQSAQRLMPRFKNFEDTLNSGTNLGLPAAALTNVQSITDSTGIPRESVRRKVKELIEAGWVERLENGSLRIAGQKAINDLRPVTERQFAVIDKTVSAMISELEDMKVLKVLTVAPSPAPETTGVVEKGDSERFG